MNKRIQVIAIALALALGSAATSAIAFDASSRAEINVSSGGVIVSGYDVVAYHAGKAEKGSARFSAEYNGAIYYFASATNRDAFQQAPQKYAPAYGGFCAMGVALGQKFDVDPTQFKVVDGVLYLNKDPEVAVLWSKAIPKHIGDADQQWPAIKTQAPADL